MQGNKYTCAKSKCASDFGVTESDYSTLTVTYNSTTGVYTLDMQFANGNQFGVTSSDNINKTFTP